jgi:hypothetical protein
VKVAQHAIHSWLLLLPFMNENFYFLKSKALIWSILSNGTK